MKKYENYKEVGLSWLKEIPEGWEVKPIRAIFYERGETNSNLQENRILSVMKGVGVVPYEDKGNVGNKASEDISKYKIVKVDDIVLNSMNVIIGSVGKSKYEGALSQVYYVLVNRNINSNNTNFLEYCFRTEKFYTHLKIYGRGILEHRLKIPMNSLKGVHLPIPPLHEQEQIANFLDWKISEIDKLIDLEKAKQERLNELEEKTIEYYLFTGVNKNYSLKAIESSYMKEIPELWDLCKISQLFKIQKRIANQSGFDVLSITQSGIKVKDISKNEGQMASDYSKYQIVEIGDFAMNHMDLITGYIDISKHRGVTSPDYRVFTVNSDDVVPEYYLYMFQLFYKKRVFYKYGRGVANQGRWRLPAKEFLNLYVPLPSKIEQKEIVKKIEEKVNQIDSLRSKIEIQISYLEELKQTLISDAVTGKIDVRNIKIPDYTHGKEKA